MEAEARELVRHDIVSNTAGRRGLGQQVPDHAAELLLGPGDLIVTMQERRELAVDESPRADRLPSGSRLVRGQSKATLDAAPAGSPASHLETPNG